MSFKDNLKTLAKEVQKPALKNYPRRHVHSSRINQFWGADLVEMGHLKTQNNNVRYLLNIVDLYSRYAWSFPLKTKTGKEVCEKFKSMSVHPEHLWVDEGTEFYNSYMKDWCEEKNINMYSSFSGLKSVFVERFNRTMKEAFQLYFLEHLTGKFLTFLPKFMEEYNHKVHRIIKETPYDVYHKIEESQEKFVDVPVEKHKFNIGDYVRISKVKRTFEKGYTERFTHEVFQIIGLDTSYSPVMYESKHLGDEIVTGKFYEQELSKTIIPQFKVIDSVVKRKKENRIDMVLVSYKGYPEKFNEWIKKSEYDKFMKDKRGLT